MRRFSQRSYLVTLSEINITPLLDLAFVLSLLSLLSAYSALMAAMMLAGARA